MRGSKTQEGFPAMDDLEASVACEIEWQTTLWNEDYVHAYDAAREVLAGLKDTGLRGYRALWYYLAGAAAEDAAMQGIAGFDAKARQAYGKAKEAAQGIPWLIALAQGEAPDASGAKEEADATLMLQIERLEGYLVGLGTLHNRDFSARESEIRNGLAAAKTFELAQQKLREHLGFSAGKEESDASPDPWWMIGDQVIVFEDHAGANEGVVLDATKARQVASHPDWIRSNVPGTEEATQACSSNARSPAASAASRWRAVSDDRLRKLTTSVLSASLSLR